MKTRLRFVLAFLLTGCASSYHPINRDGLSYKSATLSSGLDFSYNRDALQESQNPKYSRKTTALRIAVVAVKLKNKTSHPIDVSSDLQFFAGTKMINPASSTTALQRVRQSTGLYALYLLGAPLNIFGTSTDCTDGNCSQSVTFIPVGLIVGPVLMAINMGVSATANGAFFKEIQDHDLFGKSLPPGEGLSGYLVFPNTGSGALFARLKTDTTLPPPSAEVPEWEDAPPARASDFH